MDNAVMDYTKTISARLSIEQYTALVDYLATCSPNETPSDYIRRLIAEDFASMDQPYPDYEFVDNDMRSELRIRGRGKG